MSSFPCVDLCYDSTVKNSFAHIKISGKSVIIGSSTTVKIETDSTVESEALEFQTSDMKEIYAFNKTIKYGVYYQIPKKKWVKIEYGKYFVIGITWGTFILHEGFPVLMFIDKSFNFKFGKKIINLDQEYCVGKNSKSDFTVTNDPHISSCHLKVKIIKNEIFIYDNDSTNNVFLAFDKIKVEEKEMVFRIGESTFLRFYYGSDAVPLTPISVAGRPSFQARNTKTQ